MEVKLQRLVMVGAGNDGSNTPLCTLLLPTESRSYRIHALEPSPSKDKKRRPLLRTPLKDSKEMGGVPLERTREKVHPPGEDFAVFTDDVIDICVTTANQVL